jgi:chemotaxis family two-component system sensor kinase Cph1
MHESATNTMQQEIERLRLALDAETQRCIQLQRQLDGSSREFEEFVSLAVHNLRESLRDVAAFSQLMTTYADRLDSEAGMFLGNIQSGAARMESLLADIADYSAMRAANLEVSRVDMEAILSYTLLCADQLIVERKAIVAHDPLPAVMGNFELLAKVLHRLIRNAVVYCEAPSPRIHISASLLDPAWVFSVKDNGPGIDPRFHARVFKPFNRLHGKQHPGNGMGLAYCKIGIERHGGRIWIESEPGAGSIFYFTLPCAG